MGAETEIVKPRYGRGKNPASLENRSCGSEHHRWNSGRMISKEGYVKVRVGRDHPLADPNGYTYEHLLVWVSAGRPRPPRGFLIHHRNDDKGDNRLSNFELLSRADHNRHHNAQRGRDPSSGRLLPRARDGVPS